MSDDATCLQYGWNVVAAAGANSQLAGVLAGFVFTGIVFLFGRSGLRNIQAITLLSSAFVVLAFDSYLYSLVAGGTDDTICIRVWSESMPAGGLLGVGGAAVVTALCRLAYDYVDTEEARTTVLFERAVVHLHRLSRLLVYGVTVAVSLLLVSAIGEYLAVAFSDRPPPWLNGSIYAVPLVVIIAAIALEARRKRLNRRQPPVQQFSRSLSFSSFAMVAAAILGSIWAGTLTILPDSEWAQPKDPLLVSLGLFFGLALPGMLLVALTLAASRRPALGNEESPPSPPLSQADGSDREPMRDLPYEGSHPDEAR
jgi:hypothetical protein